MRASELLTWVDSGNYQNLIQGKELGDRQMETPEDDEGWNLLASWNKIDH